MPTRSRRHMIRKRSGMLEHPALIPVLLLAAWWMLLRAQNPGLMADDSGEMIAAAYSLGIPHPPGYPLFTLLGRLVLLVPLGTPAFRLNLLSSLWTLASLSLLAAVMGSLVKRWMKRPDPLEGILSTVILLLSLLSAGNVFSQSLTAKGGVYTLTLLLLTAIIGLHVVSGGKPRRGYFLTACFLWALGMANHWPTAILWIGFLLYWGWMGFVRGRVKLLAAALTSAILGFSLYLALPLRAIGRPQLDWGHPAGFSGFFWVVTRKLSAGTEPWIRPLASYVQHASEAARVLFWDPWPGQSILAILGVVVLFRKERVLGIAWSLLFVPMFLAVVVVPRPETTYLLNVYLVPVQALIVLAAFRGLLAALHWLGRFKAVVGVLRAACIMLLMATALAWVLRTAHREDRSRYLLQEDYGVNLLRALPSKAFLIGEGDVNVFPFYYHRIVGGMRPDLGMIPFVFLHHDWGWDQVVTQRPQLASAKPRVLEERLETLMRDVNLRQEIPPFPEMQELFYTLDTNYLDASKIPLDQFFRPMGLVRAVTGRKPEPGSLSRLVSAGEASQRRRGGPPGLIPDERDVVSRSIVLRYGDQHVVAGDWLSDAGMDDPALGHLDRALILCPFEGRTYAKLSFLLVRKGYWELSGEVCRENLRYARPTHSLWFNLGNASMVTGDYESAFRAYGAAFRLKPGWKEAQDQMQTALKLKADGSPAAIPSRPPAELRRLSGEFRDRGCELLARLAGSLAKGTDR